MQQIIQFNSKRKKFKNTFQLLKINKKKNVLFIKILNKCTFKLNKKNHLFSYELIYIIF